MDFGDNAEGILPREELVGREIFRVNDRTELSCKVFARKHEAST